MLISPDGWIHTPRPNKSAAYRLFCFPGGGGSASLFTDWPDLLPPSIEVCAMQLPGRPPDTDIQISPQFSNIVINMADAISRMQDRPMAFFGHCVGTILAFEVARLLYQRGKIKPEQLFFACFPPPHLPWSTVSLFRLPENDMLTKLLSLLPVLPTHNDKPSSKAGAARQQHLLSWLQLDMLLYKSYEYCPGASFACPITIFEARQDHIIPAEHFPAWQQHTKGRFDLQTFEGDHFFFYTHPAPMLQSLKDRLIVQ